MSEEKTVNGDDKITQLPNEVYESALMEIIKNNFDDDEYEIEYSAGSNKGDNYIGVVYRIEVKSKTNEEKKLQLIVKLPPQDPARREQFSARPCFVREGEFYAEIYPLYKKFQEEKGIDVDVDGYHHAPFCYKSMIEEPHEGLFFEDLKASNFEMFDRFKDLTVDHVFLAMKAIAKMHAIFFCLKDQKPELIAKYKEMEDIFMMRKGDNHMMAWFESLKETARGSLKDCDSELLEKVNELFNKSFYELLSDCITGADAEPYTILCHGDCWNNNMLFRYDENRKPVDIRLLDFQIMRYASPVCDLLYYIYCCTSKTLRDNFYEEFLNVYYDTLSSFIEKLGSNPETLFPRTAFEEHLKRFGKFGLVMGMLILPMITSNADELPDLDEMAQKMKEKLDNKEDLNPKEIMDFSKMTTANTCNQRMRDVIVDMVKFGYI